MVVMSGFQISAVTDVFRLRTRSWRKVLIPGGVVLMCQLGKNASARPWRIAGEKQEQKCPACENINGKAMVASQSILGRYAMC